MADDLSSSSDNPYFQLIPYIILHDLSLLCSFIVSQPLYSFYFILLAPYLIKLISFISPMFIAAIVISLLVTTTTAFCPKMPQLELEILQTVIEELQSNMDDVGGDEEESNFEDSEVYKIVFDGAFSITIGNEEVSQTEKNSDHGDLGMEKIAESSVVGGRRDDVTISESDVNKPEEEKGLEKLFKELERFENCTAVIETDAGADSNKVIGELQKDEPAPVNKIISDSGSKAKSVARSSSDNYKFSQISGRPSSWRSNSSIIFGSHGSMKEEKEWRKTLACKLFEERNNSRGGGDEGMDSLWEAYENENLKNRKEPMNNKTMLMKNISNGGIKSFEEEVLDDDDDDEDEPEMSNGHLCCLQALKLSTGKMNLGMGKPNIAKITKALKGFGWLHHVKNKHGKKSSGSVSR